MRSRREMACDAAAVRISRVIPAFFMRGVFSKRLPPPRRSAAGFEEWERNADHG